MSLDPRILVALLCGAAWASAPAASAQTVPKPTTEPQLRAAGHRPMTGEEMRRRYIGNTSYILQLAAERGAPAGIVYVIYYKSDRERVVRPAPGGGPVFTALWWIEGDLLCGEVRGPMPGGHRCNAIYDTPAGAYICRDGDCGAIGRMAQGNPEKL